MPQGGKKGRMEEITYKYFVAEGDTIATAMEQANGWENYK